MTSKTLRMLGLVAACGAAGSASSLALAQPVVTNIAGATLLENFFNKRASSIDFIDADGDGLARGFPLSTSDQLAPFDLPPSATEGPWANVGSTNVHWAIMYSAVGSTNGFQELIDFGRTYSTVPGTNTNAAVSLRKSVRTAAYFNRYKFLNAGTANDDNDPQFPPLFGLIANDNNPMAAPIRSRTDGSFRALYTSTVSASTQPNEGLTVDGGLTIDIAPLDVPTTYAVTQSGAPGIGLNPLQAGYGNNGRLSVDKDGSQAATGNRSQKLANLTGGANLSSTLPGVFNPAANSNTIFDTSLAFAPVAPIVNFGTGIQQIDMSDLNHLFSTGRRKTGENLMVVTRDSGSGTRNAWDNTRGIDPSWGYGENVGVRNNNSTNDELGATYLPSNKQGNNRVEPSVFNQRLAIGYVGPERGLESSGQFWLSGGLCEIAAVRNDIAPYNGTQFVRPTIGNVLDNQTGNGWVIGGPAALATFGDPLAAPAAKGGLGWLEPASDTDGNSMINPGVENWTDVNGNKIYDLGEPFVDGSNGAVVDGVWNGDRYLDVNGNQVRDAAETRPANLNPPMRNVESAAYLNNIARSIASFVSLPGSDQTLFTPGELAATQFVLIGALPRIQDPTDPTNLIPNPTFSPSLNSFIRNEAGNILSNSAYVAFGNSVAPVQPLNSRAGKVPQRRAGTYSDSPVNANAAVDGRYVTEGGTELTRGINLPLRNLIAGDFNGDGLRNVQDAAAMIGAWRKRTSGAPWTAPGASGALAALATATGQPANASDLSIEIIGDYNGDGTFDKHDLRLWADGLAIATSGPNSGNLDRKAGFEALDNALNAATSGADNNVFNTVLATGKVYQPGDARGDIANSSGRTTPGFQPIGAEGYAGFTPTDANVIDAADIDHVYNQFIGNAFVTDGEANWSNLSEAAGFDLSGDITGDLVVNQADIDEIVKVILGTCYGDVNLDGTVTAADQAIIQSSIATPPATASWSNGDLNGDNVVNAADLALYCPADINCSGSVTVQDIFDFLALYFSSAPKADINGSGSVTVQDIFDFLALYFSGC